MRALLGLVATGSLMALLGSAAHAESFYYRNVNPMSPAKAATPVKEDPKPADPKPTDPDPETGPLKLTLTPSGNINAIVGVPINAVFHASGGCPNKSFSLSGTTPSYLAGLGISARASGSDYVISGQVNRVSGGNFNITVTARDGCSATSDVAVLLSLNPEPADYDPPWNLYINDTVAFASSNFAFYPELRGTQNSDAIDQTGYTYSIHTLDPVARPLPAWLTMPDPRTGVLLGKAPAGELSYGPFYMTAAAPNGGFSQSADFIVRVVNTFVFNGPNTVDLDLNVQRTVSFSGSGGCGFVNKYYEVSSDTPLPAGMSWTYNPNGWTISGTPTKSGTKTVNLAFTEPGCGGSQFFPVTFTVSGTPDPEPPVDTTLRWRDQPQTFPIVVNGNPDMQFAGAVLDTQNGAPWNTVSCSLVNDDGSPANLAWAAEVPQDPSVCYFKFNPTLPEQVGSHVVRFKAVTDTRGSVISDRIDLVVTAK